MVGDTIMSLFIDNEVRERYYGGADIINVVGGNGNRYVALFLK
jgi:hypothetical protein